MLVTATLCYTVRLLKRKGETQVVLSDTKDAIGSPYQTRAEFDSLRRMNFMGSQLIQA
jgi:hypothetical protein